MLMMASRMPCYCVIKEHMEFEYGALIYFGGFEPNGAMLTRVNSYCYTIRGETHLLMSFDSGKWAWIERKTRKRNN